MTRAALRLLIAADPQVTVIAEADSVADVFTFANTERPDVILLDEDLCDDAALVELWFDLRAAAVSLVVLLLTESPGRCLPEILVKNPAISVISKADPPEALLKAVRNAHSAKSVVPKPRPVRTTSAGTGPLLHTRANHADDVPEPSRTETPFDHSSPVDKRVLSVLDAVERDLGKSDSVEALAGTVEISASRLRQLVRDFVGTSLTQFRKERRLQMAARLLAHTHKRVSEIAYHVGFCDLSYFSKAFRVRFGISPTRYRQRLKE
jgi:AraC-like DNA-binding protein